MNVSAKPATEPAVRYGVIDCDIHFKLDLGNVKPYLDPAMVSRIQTYGMRRRNGQQGGNPYPKASPEAARRDAWPEGGGLPGTDLGMLQRQHLDPYGIEVGLLNPVGMTGLGFADNAMSAAVARAANHWQMEALVAKEPRLRASICLPYEDAEASAAEIRYWGDNPCFAQALLHSRTSEALGRRRYWPIFEAAAEVGKPVAIHVFGYSGWAGSAAGWPSYYLEEMNEHAASCQALVSSLVFEGVFERWPKLRIVLIEAGLAWLPALMWRMDRNWERMRDEVPHVRRRPSEYVREQLWMTTQPIEEPENRAHLADILEWIGEEHVMFSSDYPHWDFDDPNFALKAHIAPELRRRILHDNANALYGFHR